MTIEPYPVFVPLFRQSALVREVSFGVFVPVWSPELVEEMEVMTILPALVDVPVPEETPDWPLVTILPEAVMGKRATPVLSDWLKKWRKEGREIGRVVELAHSVPSLRVDPRKWPEVTVEQVADLQSLPDGSVSFLWTPFSLQRAEDRVALMEDVRRAIEPGGTWAFLDVMPAAMPGHWLYQFFPQAWENEKQRTWDVAQMYNMLIRSSFQVQLERRNIYQAVALGVAQQMARGREQCPQLTFLPDEVYAARMVALEERVDREGAEETMRSEFCLVEVKAVRG